MQKSVIGNEKVLSVQEQEQKMQKSLSVKSFNNQDTLTADPFSASSKDGRKANYTETSFFKRRGSFTSIAQIMDQRKEENLQEQVNERINENKTSFVRNDNKSPLRKTVSFISKNINNAGYK